MGRNVYWCGALCFGVAQCVLARHVCVGEACVQYLRHLFALSTAPPRFAIYIPTVS